MRTLGHAALAAVLAVPCAAGPIADGWAPEAVEGSTGFEDEVWAERTDAWSATLERLDDAERWSYLRERAGAAVDPFARREPGGYLTFRFRLENLAPGTLVFEAQSCRIVARDKTTRYPLDLPTIESTYGLLEQEVPPAYRTARAALFDGTVFLERGQRAEGLLVFRALPERSKSFRLEVPLTAGDGSAGGITATYRRAPLRARPR